MPQNIKKWPEGVKKTRQRECVLSVLEKAKGPLSAAEIWERTDKGGQSSWLSTVYRTLEMFEEKGMVIKTNVMGSDTALYELDRAQHKHYAVCMGCHKIIPMEGCPMEAFQPRVTEEGFTVTGHNLEIYGYCRECIRHPHSK